MDAELEKKDRGNKAGIKVIQSVRAENATLKTQNESYQSKLEQKDVAIETNLNTVRGLKNDKERLEAANFEYHETLVNKEEVLKSVLGSRDDSSREFKIAKQKITALNQANDELTTTNSDLRKTIEELQAKLKKQEGLKNEANEKIVAMNDELARSHEDYKRRSKELYKLQDNYDKQVVYITRLTDELVNRDGEIELLKAVDNDSDEKIKRLGDIHQLLDQLFLDSLRKHLDDANNGHASFDESQYKFHQVNMTDMLQILKGLKDNPKTIGDSPQASPTISRPFKGRALSEEMPAGDDEEEEEETPEQDLSEIVNVHEIAPTLPVHGNDPIQPVHDVSPVPPVNTGSCDTDTSAQGVVVLNCQHSALELVELLPPWVWALFAVLAAFFVYLFFKEQEKWMAANELTRQAVVSLTSGGRQLFGAGSRGSWMGRLVYRAEHLIGIDRTMLG